MWLFSSAISASGGSATLATIASVAVCQRLQLLDDFALDGMNRPGFLGGPSV